MTQNESAKALEVFLRAVGAPIDSDPELKDTSRRVSEAYTAQLLRGYKKDPAAILAEATSSTSQGLVVISKLSVLTMCPHHLMPAYGHASVAYLPSHKVVGFGAIVELVDCFSRRLSLQEDLGHHIAQALTDHLGARAACCLLDMHPTCMSVDQSQSQHTRVITLAYAGKQATDPVFREEVQQLVLPHAAGSALQSGMHG